MRWIGCFAVGLAIGVSGVVRGAEGSDEEKQWEAAHKKFVEFVTPIVAEARGRLGDGRIGWALVANDVFRKHLPDVRIYVRDGAFDGQTKIWAVTKDGRIEDLGDATWKGVDDNRRVVVEKVPAFLKGRQIKVESGEAAVEVVRLLEKIVGAASFASMLRLNTKDYTVLDERFLKWMLGRGEDWKYTGAK